MDGHLKTLPKRLAPAQDHFQRIMVRARKQRPKWDIFPQKTSHFPILGRSRPFLGRLGTCWMFSIVSQKFSPSVPLKLSSVPKITH